jgi:hypothetical protein
MVIRALTPEEERVIIRRLNVAKGSGPINAFGSLEERIARLRKDLENPALSADARADVERTIAACIAAKEKRDATKRAL